MLVLRDQNPPLKETEDFKLVVGTMTETEFAGKRGYLLVNKSTDVVEWEGTSEARALVMMETEQLIIVEARRGPPESLTRLGELEIEVDLDLESVDPLNFLLHGTGPDSDDDN